MEINVQFLKMPTSESLEAFVQKKLVKLAKKYEWLIRAEVFYKLENDTTGKAKICDIRLSMPGPIIFATTSAESFEAATDETLRDIEKQLKRRKGEMKPY